MKTKSTTPEARELRMRRLARRHGLLLKKPRKRMEHEGMKVEYFLFDPSDNTSGPFYGDLETVEWDSQQWGAK